MRLLKPIAIALVAALMAACGTSNVALKTEHPFRPIKYSDDVVELTIATLSAPVAVTTEYNLRYLVTATAASGRYRVVAVDSTGGRYFESETKAGISLIYKSRLPVGGETFEHAAGGLYVSPLGAVSVYWFWGSDYAEPVRVASGGAQLQYTTEVDNSRLLARQAREERERVAQEERASEERARQATRTALAEARTRNRHFCAGPTDCDRAFALAQAYLLKQADMKIQIATSTLIETYNATDEGALNRPGF